jgi:hypothetical protein
MIKKLFLILFFLLSLNINIFAAEDNCIFGYSYFNPNNNKVILPCVDIGNNRCYWLELTVEDGIIELTNFVDTSVEIPLTEESEIFSYYIPDKKKLVIPELRIGSYLNETTEGPYKVVLNVDIESDGIFMDLDSFKPVNPTTICDKPDGDFFSLHMVYNEESLGCTEFSGTKEFIDAWYNMYKGFAQSVNNPKFEVILDKESSCPPAGDEGLVCLIWSESTDDNKVLINTAYHYVYGAAAAEGFKPYCLSLGETPDENVFMIGITELPNMESSAEYFINNAGP